MQNIFESRGGYLFRGMTLPRAAATISTNKMVARITTHSPLVKDKRFDDKTNSFSRSFMVANQFSQGDDYSIPGVVLVIDQRKLHQLVGNRLQPYDDTNTEWYRDQMRKYGNAFGDDPRTGRSIGKTEAEEIVFGDIAGINSAIHRAIVLISPYNEHEHIKRFNQSSLKDFPRVELWDSSTLAKYEPTNGQVRPFAYGSRPTEYSVRRTIESNESIKSTHLSFLDYLTEVNKRR